MELEWWGYLSIIVGLLTLFFLTGLPVAISFTLFNFIGVALWMGGTSAFSLLTVSAFSSVASFPLVAIPLFILMGELLFRCGVVIIVLDAVTKLIVGVRGSLSFVAVGAGTLFGTMSGSAVSSVAVLGSTLAPEMRRRGYDKEIVLGPILGSGCLAMLIPPSVMAILLGSLAEIPISKLLLSGLLPALLLASMYVVYLLARVRWRPELAPDTSEAAYPWGERIQALLSMAPVSILTLMIWGSMFLGLATPTEAAAIGVLGAIVVISLYRKMQWSAVLKSLMETVKITGMIFLIIISASAFSQILAFTGTTGQLVGFVADANLAPTLVLLGMLITLILLGSFLDELALMMIAVPIYMPVIAAMKVDPVWFGAMMLLTIQIATISPPYGLALFVLKGVVRDASMLDVWKASIAYMLMSTLTLAAIFLIPAIATWLPSFL